MYDIIRSDEEIDTLRNWAMESKDSGRSHYQGMSYEDGIDTVLGWLFGETDDNPAE